MPEQGKEEVVEKPTVENQNIAYGMQDPFEVKLPHEKVTITMRLATGMDAYLTTLRWKKIKELSSKEEVGFYELEIIAKCIVDFPGHPEFGKTATKEVTLNSLLFLTDIDIKVLKLAYVLANMPDPQVQSLLENLALGRTADALQEALWLVLNLEGGITLGAALELPEKVRWEIIERIQILLGRPRPPSPKQKEG